MLSQLQINKNCKAVLKEYRKHNISIQESRRCGWRRRNNKGGVCRKCHEKPIYEKDVGKLDFENAMKSRCTRKSVDGVDFKMQRKSDL